jgi:hypothetical protein
VGSIPDGVGILIHIFRLRYSPGVDSASRNEYQGYFLGGKGGRWPTDGRLCHLLAAKKTFRVSL